MRIVCMGMERNGNNPTGIWNRLEMKINFRLGNGNGKE